MEQLPLFTQEEKLEKGKRLYTLEEKELFFQQHLKENELKREDFKNEKLAN